MHQKLGAEACVGSRHRRCKEDRTAICLQWRQQFRKSIFRAEWDPRQAQVRARRLVRASQGANRAHSLDRQTFGRVVGPRARTCRLCVFRLSSVAARSGSCSCAGFVPLLVLEPNGCASPGGHALPGRRFDKCLFCRLGLSTPVPRCDLLQRHEGSFAAGSWPSYHVHAQQIKTSVLLVS
jgi:hypothetical protein